MLTETGHKRTDSLCQFAQILDNNGAATLVGVVSWGFGCGVENQLGIYSEVAFFTEWLQDNMEDLNTCSPPAQSAWNPSAHSSSSETLKPSAVVTTPSSINLPTTTTRRTSTTTTTTTTTTRSVATGKQIYNFHRQCIIFSFPDWWILSQRRKCISKWFARVR